VSPSAPAPPQETGAGAGRLEEQQVRAMFDGIAGVYDRLNSVMTAGLDDKWRSRAADLSGLGPGDHALDVATGTGKLALELARRVGPTGSVIGSDFSEEMLAIAREQASSAAAPLRFEWANAQALPYDSDTFDAVTVGFGVRNFSQLERGVGELARVTKPGGKVVILEMTTPTKPPLSTFFSLWFDRVVPRLGRLAGDEAAYTYLPNSVKRFPPPHDLAGIMAGCGLTDIRWILTAGGIIAMHVGTRARAA
jgi:demethylmenaquinone methyltransferase/2-methoxy-6-polyprenyl-1,4-benzoquinol methylase